MLFLAENIKYLREQAGMTQDELSKEIGDIGQKAVSKWEKAGENNSCSGKPISYQKSKGTG